MKNMLKALVLSPVIIAGALVGAVVGALYAAVTQINDIANGKEI